MNRAQKRQAKATKSLPNPATKRTTTRKTLKAKKSPLTKSQKRSFTTATPTPTSTDGSTPDYTKRLTPHELERAKVDSEASRRDSKARFAHIFHTAMSYDNTGEPVTPSPEETYQVVKMVAGKHIEAAGVAADKIQTPEQTAAAVKDYAAYLATKGKFQSTEDDEAQLALKASLAADKKTLDWHVLPEYPLSPKLSTCITGIPAIPNGRDVLDNLLINTISMASQRYKNDHQFIWSSIYNTAVFRLQVLRKFPNDDHMVSRIIGAGQIEELIEQQEEEMTLFQTLYDKPEPNIDPEVLRGAAPAFGSTNPLCETKIFPLPEEVAKEVAGGKVTINPYHPTKPLSRKFIQHLGFGDLITPEEHAKYDELTALNEEEQALAAKKMPFVMAMVEDDLTDSFITRQHPEGLPDDFFEFFKTSPYVYPELDTQFVNQWKEAHEIHTRKL